MPTQQRGPVIPDVKVGQVYADNDRRSAGRTLRVDAIEDGKALCTVLTNEAVTQAYIDDPASKPNWMPRAYKDQRGKQTRIALSRFVPTSTGYRLISED
jgi:hypothetical protein